MPSFLKQYGETEGPFGFPMRDDDAKALDAIAKQFPDHEYKRLIVDKATTELMDGERADVSWIQTEAVDREKEIVLATGFRDDHFKANPMVTINHQYWNPPVGRSAWRKKIKDGDRRGIKAKTIYPARPEDWKDDQWPSDSAWALVKSGLMAGKSIGFFPLKQHDPTEIEIRKNPDWAGVRCIVDEWMLLEYACCWFPMNPEAVVEAVSKSLVKLADLQFAGIDQPAPPAGSLLENFTFTPLAEIEKAIQRAINGINPEEFSQRIIQDAINGIKGQI